MNEEQIKKLKEVCKELEKDYNFNDYIENYFDDEDLKSIEDIGGLEKYLDELNDNNNYEITDTEIIYYSNAIKYLSENDASLNESIEIALEYGYTLDKINSELLASLLCSRNNQEDYYTFIKEVISEMEKYFDELVYSY
jgi:hypothetical protein